MTLGITLAGYTDQTERWTLLRSSGAKIKSNIVGLVKMEVRIAMDNAGKNLFIKL
jgi:hypothetical protein